MCNWNKTLYYVTWVLLLIRSGYFFPKSAGLGGKEFRFHLVHVNDIQLKFWETQSGKQKQELTSNYSKWAAVTNVQHTLSSG